MRPDDRTIESKDRQFRIEPARAGDLDEIRRLVSRARFDARNLDAAHFHVARLESGPVVGCAQIKPVGRQRVLSSVVVAPEYRGRQVGQALVAGLLAAEAGPVTLMCAGPLVSFYARFGFALAPAHSAPLGLAWRWVVLSVLGLLWEEYAGMKIMRRPVRSAQ